MPPLKSREIALPTAAQILRGDAAVRRHIRILKKNGQRAHALLSGRRIAGIAKKERISPSKFLTGTRRGIATPVVAGAMNLDLFEAAIIKYQISMDEMGFQTVKDFVDAVFVGIIGRTPIQTGQARNNWHMSRGSPTQIRFPGIPVGDRFKIAPGGNKPGDWIWTDQVTPGRALIRETKDIGEVLWINNNLDYIEKLDLGFSGQAPGGMTEPAMQEAAELMGGYVDAMDKAIGFDDLDEATRLGI